MQHSTDWKRLRSICWTEMSLLLPRDDYPASNGQTDADAWRDNTFNGLDTTSATIWAWESDADRLVTTYRSTENYWLSTYGRSKQCDRYRHYGRSCNQLSPQDLLNDVTSHTMTSYGHVTSSVTSCHVMTLSCVKRPSNSDKTMTSQGHVMSSMTSPFDSPWELSNRLILRRNPVSSIVVEIFSLKWLYDVITDIITPVSTIHLEDNYGALHSRCLC